MVNNFHFRNSCYYYWKNILNKWLYKWLIKKLICKTISIMMTKGEALNISKTYIQKKIKAVISVAHFPFLFLFLTLLVKCLNFPFDFSVGFWVDLLYFCVTYYFQIRGISTAGLHRYSPCRGALWSFASVVIAFISKKGSVSGVYVPSRSRVTRAQASNQKAWYTVMERVPICRCEYFSCHPRWPYFSELQRWHYPSKNSQRCPSLLPLRDRPS